MVKRSGPLLAATGVVALLFAACAPIATPTPRPIKPAATATPQAVSTAVPARATTSAPSASPTPPGPKRGGVLRHRVPGDVKSWDPGKYDVDTGEHLLWAYPRLFTYHRGAPGEEQCRILPIEPELAAGFKWADDTTLDVSIVKGVKLPAAAPLKGRELTADDVVFSFNRYFYVSKLTPLVPLAQNTDSITRVGQYVVRFKLKTPHADYVQQALGSMFAPIVPPETLEPASDPAGQYGFDSHRTGAYGRFRPTRWAPAVGTDFERNPDFFMKGLPYLDAVSLRIIPEDTTFLAAIQAGRVDSGINRSPDVIVAVAKAGIPQVVCDYSGAAPAFLNLNRTEFQDANVRRAISMAIDREALNKLVYYGYGSGAFTPIPRPLGRQWSMELEDYPPEVRRWLSYDPKAAKELLAQTAHPRGFTSKLMFSGAQGGIPQQAEAISSMVEAIGISLKLDRLTAPEYTNVIGRFPFDQPDNRHTGLLMGTIFWNAVDDLTTYTSSKSPRNRSVINDPKLDAMLDEQRRTLDAIKRQKLVKDIQVYLVDQMYFIPLPVGPYVEVYQPYVKGVYYKSFGSGYDAEAMRDVWLDK